VWLILLGQGASLQRAGTRWGWTIPRGFLDRLFQAPGSRSPLDAAVWAEVHRLGGTNDEVDALTAHPAYRIDPTESAALGLPEIVMERPLAAYDNVYPVDRRRTQREFWHATTSWLIRHRDRLDGAARRSLLDWAMHRHTEDVARSTRAEQRFSWSGRTVEAAMAQARAHEQAIEDSAYGVRHLSWPQRGWDWRYADADGIWTIRELTTSADLAEEGTALHHCVAGYDHRCAVGLSAIFSLCHDAARTLTVELEPPLCQRD
jgi:hypothetical protein